MLATPNRVLDACLNLEAIARAVLAANPRFQGSGACAPRRDRYMR